MHSLNKEHNYNKGKIVDQQAIFDAALSSVQFGDLLLLPLNLEEILFKLFPIKKKKKKRFQATLALKAKYIRENLWWKGFKHHTQLWTTSFWTLWPNHNMSTSPPVWCGTDDPAARAIMQRLKSNDMQSKQHRLSFLSLSPHLVQVCDLCGPLKQEITYAGMLHWSVSGYVEKRHANTTAEHERKKTKQTKTKWIQQRSTCVRRGG